MKNEDKLMIEELRKNGHSFNSIAEKLNIPVGSVKSFCSRNKINTSDEELTSDRCINCGKPTKSIEHHKQKKFCNDKCRYEWWAKNRDKLNSKIINKLICPVCNKEFTVAGNKKRIYCSCNCYHKSRQVCHG